MNPARYQSIHNSLSSVAKKVYQCVPIAEAWSTNQICSEIVRRNLGVDVRIATGCLNSLIQAGLVTEPARRTFRRVAVKEKPAARAQVEIAEAADTPDTPQPQEVQVTSKQSPIDKLSVLSARVLQMTETLQTLATDIDTAALEIEEQMACSDAETQKLRQLKTLLQSLG